MYQTKNRIPAGSNKNVTGHVTFLESSIYREFITLPFTASQFKSNFVSVIATP